MARAAITRPIDHRQELRMIRLMYFASLRESVGHSDEEVELDGSINNLADLRNWICQRGEPWQSALGSNQRLMMSVNQELARPDTLVSDVDEVAFFPPVTGG